MSRAADSLIMNWFFWLVCDFCRRSVALSECGVWVASDSSMLFAFIRFAFFLSEIVLVSVNFLTHFDCPFLQKRLAAVTLGLLCEISALGRLKYFSSFFKCNNGSYTCYSRCCNLRWPLYLRLQLFRSLFGVALLLSLCPHRDLVYRILSSKLLLYLFLLP